MNEENKIVLKREYSLAWAIWGLMVILCSIAGVKSLMVWSALTGIFFLIEGIALHRKKKGDTLTEHIVVFKRGGWTRLPLILGGAIWCSFKVYELTAFNTIAGAILASGFGIWFILHILFEGKKG